MKNILMIVFLVGSVVSQSANAACWNPETKRNEPCLIDKNEPRQVGVVLNSVTSRVEVARPDQQAEACYNPATGRLEPCQ